MAAITAAMVKALREKTDAPMMECKKALTEADGDAAKAEEILRVKLGNKASKAAARVTAEGVVTVYVSEDRKVGAILEVNSETDFVAKNEEFQKMAQDAVRLVGMIRRLKAVGFVISMDDFGAGYSTLNFMKSLPVDIIKIDGGFFMKNKMDDKNKAVISAIMQLSNNLHFKTVSEGVETDEQVEFIKEQGGKYVQGYYFYKPMPPEEFEGLLEEKRKGGACL